MTTNPTKVIAGVRRWAQMMEKEYPELFNDDDFIDADELTASILSYIDGNDLKYL